jgi:hypothetical protein
MLARTPVAVAAYPCDAGSGRRASMIGCTLGAVLDDPVVQAFGLRSFGAEVGDGLLAYIGIVVEARGLRLRPIGNDRLARVGAGPGADGISLARCLIDRWVSMPELERCPRIFVRTRSEIPAIVHLCESMGFERRGRLVTTFLGEAQERLVYRRVRRRPSGAVP